MLPVVVAVTFLYSTTLPPMASVQDPKSASAVKYFFGRISRDQAEDALRAAGIREGLYLLRESVVAAGNYVLSICHQGGYVTLDSAL